MVFKKFLFAAFILFQFTCYAGKTIFTDSYSSEQKHKPYHANNKSSGINIYIVSKDKYFDLINRTILWQARLSAFFHNKKFKVVTASSTADARQKIFNIVEKNHSRINNLWFDSHGKYRKGYSSFMIGSDEYNYKTISDSLSCSELKKIASLCDEHTKVGIGACYAAADYDFPVLKNGRFENMQGDSLLKGMAKIFKRSEVYGSVSWVMAKPWMFGSKNGLAGFPLNREYKDSIFLPVWKSMGEWHRYSTASQKMENINTVYLSRSGDILIQNEPYLAKKKAKRKLARNLRKLRSDLYDLRS